jgi:23S rRNA (cytidine1920-2'-O)/16S rRNA (cytidine1409-2'-O)-methyltransferase
VSRRVRLDAELVRRGLARSRDHAQELIAAGRVMVAGQPASKPATAVGTDAPVVVRPDEMAPDFVSRGGHKLAGALAVFAPRGLEVSGRQALDAGASTGGFTDVLLRAGAAHVVAVDVGYGQLAWGLQQDDRVTVLDRTNVRELTTDQLPYRPDLVVGDLSFISLVLVIPALRAVSTDDADLVLMVKPQFEVGRAQLGKGGVVREPRQRVEAVLRVAGAAHELGLGVVDVSASPLPGPSGNVEYFVWFRADAPPVARETVVHVVSVGPQ